MFEDTQMREANYFCIFYEQRSSFLLFPLSLFLVWKARTAQGFRLSANGERVCYKSTCRCECKIYGYRSSCVRLRVRFVFDKFACYAKFIKRIHSYCSHSQYYFTKGDSTCGQRALYEIGMTGIPIYNCNNNCSTGATALMLAKQLVETGNNDCVLAVGFEKMQPGSLSTMVSKP